MTHMHGLRYDAVAPRSKLYQGPFGRLFPELPPWRPAAHPADVEDLLWKIAENMIEAPGVSPSDIVRDPKLSKQLEKEFGSDTPAGYTYFGQFIDHDITFDPVSSLQHHNDPNRLANFRTPRLDLDSLYGRGPEDQPYLYTNDPPSRAKFLIGRIAGSDLQDLPRNSNQRAIIGDMRNDENSIISQLQLAFLLAHNTLVDRAVDAGIGNAFQAAQTTLRWLYQWIVWHDFLSRISLIGAHRHALQLVDVGGERHGYKLGFDDLYSWKHTPFMPVEFSVAAYRFGHSMVRNSYQTNSVHRKKDEAVPIFDNSATRPHDKKPPVQPDDLRGFRAMLAKNVPQWDWFLQMESSSRPFPQKARKLDTKLSNALAVLPIEPAGDRLNHLGFRNMARGVSFDLPSGTDVARRLGVDDWSSSYPEADQLWLAILDEAGTSGGDRMGKVGSIIVCAVFAGLLAGDPGSWINVHPRWTPDADPLLRDDDSADPETPGDKAWRLSSIIRLAGLPVAGHDF